MLRWTKPWLPLVVSACLVFPALAIAKDKKPEEALPSIEGVAADAGEIGEEEAVAEKKLTDEEKRTFFEAAYETAKRRNWYTTARHFYDIKDIYESGTQEYDAALYFMAKSFEELHLDHAATEYYYEVVRSAGNTDFIDDAVRFLEELVVNHPYDEELVIDDLLFSVEMSFLPPQLMDFVEFYQGLNTYKQEMLGWARKHFRRIREESYYDYRVRFIEGVELVKSNKVEKAMELFQSILDAEFKDFNLKNDVRRTIARLKYEGKKYDEAYQSYTDIDSPLWQQADIFLEKGWSTYMLKNRGRSLGVLLPLQAPMFAGYLAPDSYVVNALIYKELCMFSAALAEVDRFRERYGSAIRMIREREDLTKNQALMDAIYWRSALKRRADFLDALKKEFAGVKRVTGWKDNGLHDHLTRIYELKIRETERRLDDEIFDNLQAVSEKLLEYDEQMNILRFEVKLEELKRIKLFEKSTIKKEKKIPLVHGDTIYWPFEGEFWPDELLDYRSMAKSQCKGRVLR